MNTKSRRYLFGILLMLSLTFFGLECLGANAYFFLEKPTRIPDQAPFSVEQKMADPILKRGVGIDWDSVDVLNPSVIIKNGVWLCYFSGFDGTVWRTGLATSCDGLNWRKYHANPILDISKSGWDSSYIAANGCAIEIGRQIYYYYQGRSEDTPTSIGLAVSEDGIKFEKLSDGPVLRPGQKHSWDCMAVADPYVLKHGPYYFMYYLGMDEMHRQRIGVARSVDGKTWTKSLSNPILDVGAKGTFDERGLGEPSVIFNPPFFYMIYTGRAADETRDLGLALSLDGINWQKLSVQGLFPHRSDGNWDSKVICDSSLIRDYRGKLMIYYGGGNRADPAENLNGQIGLMYANIDGGRSYNFFDVRSDWKRIPLDTRDLLKGSYEIEQDLEGRFYTWCQDHVSISLFRTDEKKPVRIQGYIPFSSHQKHKLNQNSIILEVSINGTSVHSQAFWKDQSFSISLDNDRLSKMVTPGKFYDLEIKTNSNFVPANLGMSQDKRVLSIILHYLGEE